MAWHLGSSRTYEADYFFGICRFSLPSRIISNINNFICLCEALRIAAGREVEGEERIIDHAWPEGDRLRGSRCAEVFGGSPKLQRDGLAGLPFGLLPEHLHVQVTP